MPRDARRRPRPRRTRAEGWGYPTLAVVLLLVPTVVALAAPASVGGHAPHAPGLVRLAVSSLAAHGSPRLGAEAPGASTPASAAWNATGWYNLGANETNVPGYTIGPTFAYDPVLRGDLYFGGSTSNYLGEVIGENETWLLNATGWHNLSVPESPPLRGDASMAWDASDQEMILFGGANTYGTYGSDETWAFANGTWTNVTESGSPPPQYGGTMFSDPNDSSVVTFGGEYFYSTAGPTFSNSTWEYYGHHWHDVAEGKAPSVRAFASSSWDTAAGEAVVFGGYSFTDESGYTYPADTWAFANHTWIALKPAKSPAARYSATMTDDPSLGGLLLFGGTLGSSESPTNDTWVFAAGTWTPFSSEPAPPVSKTGPPMMAVASDGISLILLSCNPPGPQGVWEFSTLQPSIVVTPAAQEGSVPIELAASVVGLTYAANYSWTLDDGTTAYGPTVAHTFAALGEHNVSLAVRDSRGHTAATTRSVGVYPVLTYGADVTPPEGPAPLQIRFDAWLAGGDPPYSLEWSSPAIPGLTGPSGTLAIDTPGAYTLTFAGADAAGFSVLRTFQIVVVPAPSPLPLSAGILANVTGGPAPLSVGFVGVPTGGVPPYRLAWAFGAGLGASGSPVVERWSAPGEYPVSLTVEDAAGDLALASTVVTVTTAFFVHALVTPPRVGTTVAATASGIDGTPPYSFYWTWGDGTVSSGVNASHAFARAGNYSVELTGVDGAGRTATAWSNVTVTASPPVAPAGAAPGPSVPLAVFAVTGAAVSGFLGAGVVLARHRRGGRRPPALPARPPARAPSPPAVPPPGPG